MLRRKKSFFFFFRGSGRRVGDGGLLRYVSLSQRWSLNISLDLV